MSAENIKQKLNALVYCCMGMTEEYMSDNMGEAKGWMGQVAKAYREYEEAIDDDEEIGQLVIK